LTRLIIAARAEFPAALAAVRDWLQPIEYPNYTVHLLHEAGVCTRFPEDALHLLDAVFADQQWAPPELGQCLDEIARAEPPLTQNARYLRLQQCFRRSGI
jgi:hypothetical protein